MTEAGRDILQRLDNLKRHLDDLEHPLSRLEKRILTKAGLYQAMIAAYALVAAMYVGVFFVCRAIVSGGPRCGQAPLPRLFRGRYADPREQEGAAAWLHTLARLPA